ncbi:MAG TPA: hypothetical protein VMV98_06185 [Acidobacteriaceae bacterium]|nr:hypothetical protein [Acidobacteriaceae bacterium]
MILAALTPLVEYFDHWDGKQVVPANDTELSVTVLFVWAGFAITIAKLMRYVIAVMGFKKRSSILAPEPRPRITRPNGKAVAVTGSPPLIPLRI